MQFFQCTFAMHLLGDSREKWEGVAVAAMTQPGPSKPRIHDWITLLAFHLGKKERQSAKKQADNRA